MSEEHKLAELLAGPVKPRGIPADAEPTEELETVDKPEVQADGRGAPALSGVSVVNLFRHPEAHPVILDLCLLRKYGSDWLVWEPETLARRIPQDFKGVEVSESALSKVQACKTLHLVDTFWDRWEVFGWCTMALNNVLPDFEVMQVPSVAQCLISVDIANKLRDDAEWSSEVTAYLEAVHRHDGIFVPIAPLEFVAVDVTGLPLDVEEIRKKWPEVRDSGHAPSEESVTAEQLRRMLVVHSALKNSRDSFRSQLPLVDHV